MPTLLRVDCSARHANSTTRKLSSYFSDKWRVATKGAVIERDLLKSNIQFLDEQTLSAFAATEPDAVQMALRAQSDEFIAELVKADVFVFGIPMYWFGVPGVFKSYVDLVTRNGQTFSTTSGAPQGLLVGKKAFLITASSNEISATTAEGADAQSSLSNTGSKNFVEPYLRTILKFWGVNDVTVLSVVGKEPVKISESIESAKHQIDSVFGFAQ